MCRDLPDRYSNTLAGSIRQAIRATVECIQFGASNSRPVAVQFHLFLNFTYVASNPGYCTYVSQRSFILNFNVVYATWCFEVSPVQGAQSQVNPCHPN